MENYPRVLPLSETTLIVETSPSTLPGDLINLAFPTGHYLSRFAPSHFDIVHGESYWYPSTIDHSPSLSLFLKNGFWFFFLTFT